MIRRATFALLLSMCTLAAVVHAEQLVGMGGTYWSRTQGFSTTSAPMMSSSIAGAQAALFAAGAPGDSDRKIWNAAVLTTDAAVGCCWTLSSTATIDLSTMEVSSYGRGACMRLAAAAVIWNERPSYTDVKNTGGSKPGICVGQVTRWEKGLAGDARLHPPCRTTSDCAAHSVSPTTCATGVDITEDMKKNVGVYLVCEAPSGTSNVTAMKQRVTNFTK